MNAIRVSKRAARKLGITAILMIVPAQAADLVVTVTGEIHGGSGDYLHLFGKNKSLMNEPFEAVFTFDDTKGKPMKSTRCHGPGGGIEGTGEDSPGNAVITIEGKSYEFGSKPKSTSFFWREIDSNCGQGFLSIRVQDSPYPFNIAIDIRIHAKEGKILSRNPDWKGSTTITDIEIDNQSGFVVSGPNSGSGGIFTIQSIKIEGRKLGPGMSPGR